MSLHIVTIQTLVTVEFDLCGNLKKLRFSDMFCMGTEAWSSSGPCTVQLYRVKQNSEEVNLNTTDKYASAWSQSSEKIESFLS